MKGLLGAIIQDIKVDQISRKRMIDELEYVYENMEEEEQLNSVMAGGMVVIKIMNKKAIQRLQQMLDWSDRLGSDEVSEINSIILLLKKEDNE